MKTYKDYLPKYIQIKELIKSRIRSGYYRHGQKLSPRTALAKEFKTTLSTCSKAVDELLHEKELETQIGVGTFIAERNIGRKLQIYGIVRTLNNPFYGKFADTLGRILEEKNFLTAKIISTQYDPVKEVEIVQSLLKENNVRIVMCGFLAPETRVLILEQPERFYIFGDAPEIQGRANLINTDTEQGAFMSVNHLIEMGHRDIGIITIFSERDFKAEGYRNALSEAGIGFVEEYVANISPATDRIPEEALGNEMNAILDKFLKCERMPSAVFCTSDFIAVNFISACQMRGLKIPDDFSVCGYDGAFAGYTGAYQISTAIQPLDKLFKKVLNHLASEKTTDFMDLKLPPVLRYGNTVRNVN
jgi:LacI family transcriptional regulator